MAMERFVPHHDAMFDENSASWRMRHPLRVLGVPRAVLLQVAEPAIAHAVTDGGTFETDPVGRLQRTLGVLQLVRFGSPEEANRIVAMLERRHDGIPGADDPALRWWVVATGMDSALALDRRWFGVADTACARRFYGEGCEVALRLGIPASVLPPDLESFEAWMADRVQGLRVDDDARHVARLLFEGPVPGSAAARRGLRAVTADLLPASLRDAYDLRSPRVLPPLAALSRVATGVLLPARGHLPGHPGRRLEQRLRVRYQGAG